MTTGAPADGPCARRAEVWSAEDVQNVDVVQDVVQRDEADVHGLGAAAPAAAPQLRDFVGHDGVRHRKHLKTLGELEHVVHLLSGWSPRGRLLNAPAAGELVERAISTPWGGSPRNRRFPDTSARGRDDRRARGL